MPEMSLLDYALLKAFVACQEAGPEEETWPMRSAWSLRPFCEAFGPSQEEGHV